MVLTHHVGGHHAGAGSLTPRTLCGTKVVRHSHKVGGHHIGEVLVDGLGQAAKGRQGVLVIVHPLVKQPLRPPRTTGAQLPEESRGLPKALPACFCWTFGPFPRRHTSSCVLTFFRVGRPPRHASSLTRPCTSPLSHILTHPSVTRPCTSPLSHILTHPSVTHPHTSPLSHTPTHPLCHTPSHVPLVTCPQGAIFLTHSLALLPLISCPQPCFCWPTVRATYARGARLPPACWQPPRPWPCQRSVWLPPAARSPRAGCS